MNLTARLTNREFDLAEQFALGLTKKEIARVFYISVRTVENTLRNVYVKADVTKAQDLLHGISASVFM